MLGATATCDDIHYDHADWADAVFHVAGAAPQAVDPPVEQKVMLTPNPPPGPGINGPKVYGVRPGRPFIYRIPATGRRPMIFDVANLPTGLMLDRQTGIITGNAPGEKRTYLVVLKAQNAQRRIKRPFSISVGDTLAVTPAMGWNSWYIHYHRVSDADMRAAADAMIESGVADFGYQYVNIDDWWMD